ncbi:MAG: T9SS type A sorting domain-containing protein, partial [Bacteroidota bacterium]
DGRPVGNNDGFDFSAVGNVVFSFGGLQPNPNMDPPQDFALSFDDIVFSAGPSFETAAGELPEVFAGAPVAFPNPTTGASTVAFELVAPSAVTVDVLDVLGRRVLTLAEGTEAAGLVQLDVPRGSLSTGTYLVRVQTEAGVASTRLTVVR